MEKEHGGRDMIHRICMLKTIHSVLEVKTQATFINNGIGVKASLYRIRNTVKIFTTVLLISSTNIIPTWFILMIRRCHSGPLVMQVCVLLLTCIMTALNGMVNWKL